MPGRKRSPMKSVNRLKDGQKVLADENSNCNVVMKKDSCEERCVEKNENDAYEEHVRKRDESQPTKNHENNQKK